jgi:CheY-like chemotaxis protein
LLRLLEELLDISRVAVDCVQLERVPVDLRPLVQRAVAGAAADAAERQVVVRVELCDESLLVAGDRRRLEQVTTHLLSNALALATRGGTITFTLDHDGSSARLVVTNTGRGFAPERLPHVFDAFRHAAADHATTDDGLGLYVVREVVLMHGGRIVAESDGPTRGARLVVSLPLASVGKPRREPGGASAPPSARRGAGAGMLEGLRVLVVDDEDDARELMATVLRHRGAVVTVAGDVSAALQAFSLSQPDVLVSDMAMPGRTGLDLARELRARPTTTAAMVAVSGFTSPEEIERALDAGFDIHVAKPLDAEDLVRAVRDAARLRVH